MKEKFLKSGRKNFLCLVTCAKAAQARKIAAVLIRENLASCVNTVPKMESFYKWRGKFCRDREALLMIKGNSRQKEHLARRIRSLHSYDVPEIIFFKIDSGFGKYIDWLNEAKGKR